MGYVLLPKYTIINNFYCFLNVFGNILDLCNVYFGDLGLF